MSIINREYYAGVDEFKQPRTVIDQEAIGARILNLFMMEPGDDPLHPDMGIGIETYRYTLDTLSDLQNRIQNQIETYLPFYQNSNISLIVTPDKLINVEITIGDYLFVYDSADTVKPISLSDL